MSVHQLLLTTECESTVGRSHERGVRFPQSEVERPRHPIVNACFRQRATAGRKQRSAIEGFAYSMSAKKHEAVRAALHCSAINADSQQPQREHLTRKVQNSPAIAIKHQRQSHDYGLRRAVRPPALLLTRRTVCRPQP